MTDGSSESGPTPVPAAEAVPVPQPVHTAADWLENAMQHHRQGRIDEAASAYQHTLALAPDDAQALHMLGVLHGQFGSRQQALALIGRAIALAPAAANPHNNLGNVLQEDGQLAEAEACYRRAVALDPAHHQASNNLGVLLARLGQDTQAEQIYLQLLQAAPDFGDARENLANLYLRQGRLDEALKQCAAGLITSPRNRGLRRLVARTYAEWGMVEQAAQVYREWIRDEPHNPRPVHYLAALTGQNVPARASDAYVAQTFDAFADSFDGRLAQLQYHAPTLVGQALAARLGAPAARWRIVDAGCGTGLCAPHLAPYASQLVGVDLSHSMLVRAGQRGGYSELVQAELVAFLQSRPGSADVIVSADTLCYFGALPEFADAAWRSLGGQGWLIFTVESHADDAGAPEYLLQPHGRYSHRASYLRRVLLAAGFEPRELSAATLRLELNQPVAGWLVCARAGAVPPGP
jgi:predicted TPR repeat methyltransferase